jgi:hypothetical protein
MNTRRQFFGTLGKALGAGGLLLPWSGKGALALPADLGKAAQIPLTAAPMPFSAECLQLREINGRSTLSRSIATSTEASQAQEHLGTKQ